MFPSPASGAAGGEVHQDVRATDGGGGGLPTRPGVYRVRNPTGRSVIVMASHRGGHG